MHIESYTGSKSSAPHRPDSHSMRIYTDCRGEGGETMQNAGLHVVKHIYAQTGKGQYVKYSHMKLIR